MDVSTTFCRQGLDTEDRLSVLPARIFPLGIGDLYVDQVDKGQPEDLGPARPVTHRAPSLNSINISGTTYLVPGTVVDTGCIVRMNQIQISACTELIFHWGKQTVDKSQLLYNFIQGEKK